MAKAAAKTSTIGNAQKRRRRRKHNARAKAAQRDAKWTVEDDATIVRMIDEGSTYNKIALKLGKDLKRMDIINRWTRYLKESSGIIKPAVLRGKKSCITWTAEDDAAIVRMRMDNISLTKIASKLGNSLTNNGIMNRWNRHLSTKEE